MNKSTLIVGSLLAFLAVSAFTFNGLKNEDETDNHQPETVPSCLGNFNASLTDIINGPMQDRLFYSVISKYSTGISKGQMNNAKYIDELIPNYPSNWIEEYKQVTIVYPSNGKEERLSAPDNKLNPTQQAVLKSLGVNDYVSVEVDYRMRNPVTNQLEDDTMIRSVGILPASQAYYPDGYEALITYLKQNSQYKIKALRLPKVPEATLEFTVNEKGKVTDAKLLQPSQNEKVDEILLQLIEKMPNWKPATDANGNAVSQKFEFRIGVDMC